MSASIGKFIGIEGLEGAGKSTAIDTVVELLASKQIKTITTREPGGTSIGEILRTIIKNPEYKEVLDDKSELLLLYTSRIQLINEVIKPALSEGIWVIADRFELSTRAYQGGGRGIDKSIINQLSTFCLGGFKPDITLFLDISPEQGMHRAQLRGAYDRIEQQHIDFFHRVHATYLQAIASNPDIIRIDASLPLSAVQDAVKHVTNQFINTCRS